MIFEDCSTSTCTLTEGAYRGAVLKRDSLEINIEVGAILIVGYKRVPIEIKDASRSSKAFGLEVFIGDINDVLKDDWRVRTDIDIRLIRWVGGVSDLLLQVFEGVDIRLPFALIFVVAEKAHEVNVCRFGWTNGDIPKRIIVVGIFRLAFSELDDFERVIGIGTNVGLVYQLEDRWLPKILVVLNIYEKDKSGDVWYE